ncbi:MAG TPA: hypothetical protein VII68_03705 [Casimicrobiaceae bacterium]|jgi:hypothetical protein
MRHPLAAHAVAIALAAALAVPSALAQPAAQPLAVGTDATVEKVLVAQVGKRVTLKLGPGDELTGTVKLVTAKVVHLSDVAGREFFDAVVDTTRIVAVLVRTK